MKRLFKKIKLKQLLVISFLLFSFTAFTQVQMPVHWTFTSKKIGVDTYEIHLTAAIDKPWHIYSQTQPVNAINIPVSIVFHKNPLLVVNGKMKEEGRMEKVKDKITGIEANEYHGKVDFIQIVKIKRVIKTNVSGVINYQICNEEKCLPPATINFSIALK